MSYQETDGSKEGYRIKSTAQLARILEGAIQDEIGAKDIDKNG